MALGECVGSTLVAVLSLIEAPHPLHTNISKGLLEQDVFFDDDRIVIICTGRAQMNKAS